MSAGDVVKPRTEGLLGDSSERMYDTLKSTSITQSVEIHQRLWRLLVIFFTVRRVHLTILAVTVGNSIRGFVDWCLITDTPIDQINCLNTDGWVWVSERSFGLYTNQVQLWGVADQLLFLPLPQPPTPPLLLSLLPLNGCFSTWTWDGWFALSFSWTCPGIASRIEILILQWLPAYFNNRRYMSPRSYFYKPLASSFLYPPPDS